MKPYPYADGDTTVLGPEIFASADGQVICWRGENYVPQPPPDDGAQGAVDNSGVERAAQALARVDQLESLPGSLGAYRAAARAAIDAYLGGG